MRIRRLRDFHDSKTDAASVHEKPRLSPDHFVDDQYSNADNHGTNVNWEFHDEPGITPRTPMEIRVDQQDPFHGRLTWIDWFLELKAIVEDEDPETGRRAKVAEKSGHWVSMKGYWGPDITPDHGGFE